MKAWFLAALAALLAWPVAAEPIVTVTVGPGSVGCTTLGAAEAFATMEVGNPMPAGCTRLPPLADIPVTRVSTVDGIGAGNAPARWDVVFWQATEDAGVFFPFPGDFYAWAEERGLLEPQGIAL